MVKTTSFMLVLAMAFALGVACGDDDPTQAEAEQELCDSLGSLRDSLSGLSDVETSEALEESRDDVSAAFDDVIDAVSGVAGVTAEAIRAAYNEVVASLDDLPDDASISDAIDAIEPGLDSLRDAIGEVFNGLDCEGG